MQAQPDGSTRAAALVNAGKATGWLAATSLLLAACSTSPESLEKAAEDLPGVLQVEAAEVEGNDSLPFVEIAKEVEVQMDADSTATQIQAVFGEYADEIDDGDVQSVEVVLDSANKATLVTGSDTHATREMVEDLVEAGQDDNITEYHRQADPVLPSVTITLAQGCFDEVIAVADRYRDVETVELVEVVSGDFIVIRDEVNENVNRAAAREAFAAALDRRFRLTGAVASGRGPLELSVAPADVRAARTYVAQHRGSATLIGRVVIGTGTGCPATQADTFR